MPGWRRQVSPRSRYICVQCQRGNYKQWGECASDAPLSGGAVVFEQGAGTHQGAINLYIYCPLNAFTHFAHFAEFELKDFGHRVVVEFPKPNRASPSPPHLAPPPTSPTRHLTSFFAAAPYVINRHPATRGPARPTKPALTTHFQSPRGPASNSCRS